ncbi:hypothetical protein ACIBQX_11675 [Nonomuraea sp. NPDC049714]
MTGDLRPYCCVVAELDGISAEDHARVCRVPRPNPDLLDEPKRGG